MYPFFFRSERRGPPPARFILTTNRLNSIPCLQIPSLWQLLFQTSISFEVLFIGGKNSILRNPTPGLDALHVVIPTPIQIRADFLDFPVRQVERRRHQHALPLVYSPFFLIANSYVDVSPAPFQSFRFLALRNKWRMNLSISP